jgi:hypothetical protein
MFRDCNKIILLIKQLVYDFIIAQSFTILKMNQNLMSKELKVHCTTHCPKLKINDKKPSQFQFHSAWFFVIHFQFRTMWPQTELYLNNWQYTLMNYLGPYFHAPKYLLETISRKEKNVKKSSSFSQCL